MGSGHFPKRRFSGGFSLVGQLSGWHCSVVRLLVSRLHGTRLLGAGVQNRWPVQGGDMGGFFILRVIMCLLLPPATPQRTTGVPYLLSCDWISSEQIGHVVVARASFLSATLDNLSLSRKTLLFGS